MKTIKLVTCAVLFAIAMPASAVVFHSSDGSILGSLCVGIDCATSESFGFDTLRLKENNLRLHFDDTSSSASFPNNDWRLVANDSSNGGLNHFSIEDVTGGRTPFRIEAGAPTNSLYVEADGDVGVNTSNPVVELHIVDGDSPTLRLEQDSSSGFTPQTWDVAGNEANFFVRDVTGGSQLPFRIKPGADSDSLFIAANNDIGMGTDSPADTLHLRKTSGNTTDFRLENSSGGGAVWRLRANQGNSTFTIQDGETNSSTFKIEEAAGNNRLVIDSSGAVGINTATPNAAAALDVNGSIYQSGGVLHADYVFESDYVLESIEDHASFMWTERHLPAVPKREVDETGQEFISIGAHRRGILEELEKAHIYIEQLHERLSDKEAKLDILFAERLERLNGQPTASNQ